MKYRRKQKPEELIYKYYCRLCWQEFDHIDQHNAGSWLGRERLNGICKGDIKPCKEDIPDIAKEEKTYSGRLF